jgi:carbon starvation protein
MIGFGSMLAEGFLAVLVLVCVSAGLGLGLETKVGVLTGVDAFKYHYSSWATSQGGIGVNIHSFVVGASNFIQSVGISKDFAIPAIAVFIVSFANTTLDSATRIQRLSLQELMSSIKKASLKSRLTNRYFSTFIVVIMASVLTFLKPGGTGAKLLWPLFGSLNQLLAALGLAVVTLYLYRKSKNFVITAIPMLFVLTMTIWAMIGNFIRAIYNREIVLVILTLTILFLTSCLIYGSVKIIFKQFRSWHRNH